MSKKQTYCRNELLLDAEFKERIEEVRGDTTKARRKLCGREFNLSNMGTAALKSHLKYQKHIGLVKIKKGASDFVKKASSDHHVDKKMEILKLIQIYNHLLKKMSQKPKYMNT